MKAAELRGVIGDWEVMALQIENEIKRAEALEKLGAKYACHPANQVRLQRQEPVLAAWAHA